MGVSEEVSSFGHNFKKEVSVSKTHDDDDKNTIITFSTAQCSIK